MALISDIHQIGLRADQPLATSVPAGVLYYVTDEGKTERSTGSAWEDYTDSGGTAPSNADYLIGTANGALASAIVVGTTPGGELGGTWGSPTVDATHSGSAHTAIPYTPTDNDDWDSAADPGSAQDGLDQLASREMVLERTELPQDHISDQVMVESGLTLTEIADGSGDAISLGIDTAVVVTVSNTSFVDLTDGGETTLHSHTSINTDPVTDDASESASTPWDNSWEWCHRGQQTVTAADTTATVTHGFNDSGAIIPTPGVTWNTTVYVSAQSATSVTFTYGTPCPAGGGTLHWVAMI